MLFKLLLPYLRFGWDSLDLCELASKENLYPAFSVLIRAHPWLVIYLLAAEQCWRSGIVVYVVFLTNHTPCLWSH